jgi:hypothetical protein
MKQEHKTNIERIMGSLSCPKSFQCYNTHFEVLCHARDIGLYRFVECLEEDPEKCPFSISLGVTYCKCPVRVYIAKQLKK